MTGKELILWIEEHNAQDLIFEVQYRDAGGDYYGTDEMLYLAIEENKVIL